MLIKDDEVSKRLNNPLNLMNRMRVGLIAPKRNAMDLFVKKEEKEETKSNVPAVVVPASNTAIAIPSDDSAGVSSGDLIEDLDTKIKLGTAHDNALTLLNNSLISLNDKIINKEVKASSIPSIVSSASRVITDIRKERLEREKSNKNENVHFHFYCPTQRKLDEYEVIEVTG